MDSTFIRVNQPILDGNEKKYLCQAIDEGEVSSTGRFVRQFEERFAKWANAKYAVAVCNGTAALDTALFSSPIEDQISMPTGTIISCYLATLLAGLRVNLYDTETVAENVMRCHLFGKVDNSIGANVIDDCSQYWAKFPVKDVSCYSLYANKLITSGEGGVLVTNTRAIYENAVRYRNLCHSEERFVHDSLGYNFRMSNIQGAVALAQLEQIDRFIEIKQKNRDIYKKLLPDVEILFDVEVPWMYLIKTPYPAQWIVNQLAINRIDSRRYFCPLHKQPCIHEFKRKSYPVSEDLWEHALYLPSGDLTRKEIERVCQCLKSILNSMT